jgi:hypothetical protein
MKGNEGEKIVEEKKNHIELERVRQRNRNI